MRIDAAMERKRKLPARAAARVEHIAKKRTATPPERSVTPVSATTPTSQPPPEAPAQLPKSVQSGMPLPTVEDAQPDDLPLRDYQNIQESGVLSESLQRSRQRWIAEGIFEKYWTKPTKRKGVVNEEPGNPPKESMSRLGPVTITIEPHIFEATMYAVKDPKPPPIPAPTTQATFRPIMQFGPPHGAMPPPPTPKVEATASVPTTPTVADAKPTPPPHSPAPVPAAVTHQPQSRPQSSAANESPRMAPAAQGNGPALAPAPGHVASPSPVAAASPSISQPHMMGGASTPRPVNASPATTGTIHAPLPTTPTQGPHAPIAHGPAGAGTPGPISRPSSTTNTPAMGAAKPAAPAAAKPTGTDPIIMTLAEKASEDPQLRDLMKRVAAGEARQEELTSFQRIIDQITIEYKRRGGQQGPSADRLIVDGKTVKYFADEVRAILDIVLATNPQQKSSTLLPPAGSDALVVALVKAALDDTNTRGMIRRIAENKPGFTDATDLKAILDKLHKNILTAPPQFSPKPPQQPQSATTTPVNGVPNGHMANQLASPSAAHSTPHNPPQQALRSKGPPPVAKPEISALVLEFAGGNGDRYLFPKFSIIEYLQGGHQAYASFLIVRKGSHLEYGGDAKLDYYQPVTIRLFSSGRHLDNLHRVVAPQDEVRRYMDDVMDNMTRAEYVVLAMRLPRGDPGQDKDGQARDSARANGSTEDVVLPPIPAESAGPTKPPVLWGPRVSAFVNQFQEKEQYDDFVRRRRVPGHGGVLTNRDGVYGNACSVLGLNEADFADYDKIIAGLVAKDEEAA